MCIKWVLGNWVNSWQFLCQKMLNCGHQLCQSSISYPWSPPNLRNILWKRRDFNISACLANGHTSWFQYFMNRCFKGETFPWWLSNLQLQVQGSNLAFCITYFVNWDPGIDLQYWIWSYWMWGTIFLFSILNRAPIVQDKSILWEWLFVLTFLCQYNLA